MIGIGSYEVRVRMGGPGVRDPLPTTIIVGGEDIAIGEVGVMRVYRFLAPTDARGALAVIVKSAMVQPPGDSRRLGVLFDDLEIRSTGWTLPSMLTLVVAVVAFGSGWMTIASSRDIFGCSKNRQNRIVENSTYPLDDFGFR